MKFTLSIQNESPFSGKLITSFKVERMSLNSLALCPKHKIEMQIIYDGRQAWVDRLHVNFVQRFFVLN